MQPVAFPPPSLWARPDEEQYPSAALAGLKISPFEEISSASSASYSPVTNPTRHPTSSLSDGDTEKELEQKGCVPYRPAGLLMNAQRLYRPAGRNPLQPNHDTWRTYRPPQYIPSRNRSPQRNYRFICSRSRSRSSSDSNHSTSRRKHSYSRSSRADYDKGRERAYSRERRTTRYSSSHRYRSSSRSSSRDRRSRGHRSYSSDDNRRSSQRSSRRNRSPSRSPSRGVDRDCRSHSRDASPKKSTSYFQRHSSKSSPLKNSEKKAAKLNDAEDDKNLRTAKTERKKSHKHMKASGGDNLANAQRTKPCDIENSLPVKTTSFLCAGNDVSSTTKSTLDCKLPLEVASAIEDLFLPWVQELIADDNMAEDENSSQEAVQELEDFGSIRDSLMDAKENELQETLEELKLWWPIDDVEIIVQQVHG
ncbi:PHD and RING finger domain-containing protein 1-like isoform X2 [Paramacrobiotus metropolitanus]|uniref:PHD and RING finger domain-containing protein 1-like isoform X2 n=1 Tax=Paramacrobiotus metropolitanus TaxID=2943436 RepID=UPI0024456BBC|nr:PHD and RING finger domain-containing protein 1-like isoform X2 [Paramacrobiotus metropolitanus]